VRCTQSTGSPRIGKLIAGRSRLGPRVRGKVFMRQPHARRPDREMAIGLLVGGTPKRCGRPARKANGNQIAAFTLTMDSRQHPARLGISFRTQ